MNKRIIIDNDYLECSYEIAGRVVDPLTGALNHAGKTYPLRRKQLEVLALLASADGAMVERQQFIEVIWDGNALIGNTALTDTISALRRSLTPASDGQPIIRTLPRRGYQLTSSARILNRAGETSFEPGMRIGPANEWQLEKCLSRNEISETWRACHQTTQDRHIFRFCRSEQHLRILRRELKVSHYLQTSLARRKDIAAACRWQLDEPPYYLEFPATTHGSLLDYCHQQTPLEQIPLRLRLEWIQQTLTALSAVHELDLVHRNISPDSILIEEDNGSCYVQLGGFGFGEVKNLPALTKLDITFSDLTIIDNDDIGHQLYEAPEYENNQSVTTASDIYSLGIVLLQISLGSFSKKLSDSNLQQVNPEALRKLIRDCTSHQASHRPDATEAGHRLRQIIDQLDAPPAQPKPGQPSFQPTANTGEITVGSMIGPYRILEVLGEGGMGTAYLAEQRDPVERKVVIKVIKTHMENDQVKARFEAECQALAMMEHPNIAAIYETGCSESGRLYLVMEYVAGRSIIEHSDLARLDIKARIELFLQVCRGVQHAHQKGLIHRDLKPSNILVKTPPGQRPQVKIIDFGGVKSLQGKLSLNTVHTRIGNFIGTPSYCSPEQIAGHLGEVDTRSDVYSLGVVLYELLVGVKPYDSETLAEKSPSETLRFLIEKEPPSPLERFTILSENERATIAKNRHLNIDRLRRSLTSDSSWIIAKCLERNPQDRYSSVVELKKDLTRWINHQPVEAHPPTAIYRLRKVVQRHRTAALVTSLASILIVASITAAIIGFIRAERAVEATTAAMVEAEMAAEFQLQQLRSIDPAAIATGLRSSLRQSIQNTLTEKDQPETVIAESLQRFDQLLQGINLTDLTLEQLEAQYFQPALDTIDRNYREYPLLQARLRQATALTLQHLGRNDQALLAINSVLQQRNQLLDNHHPLIYSALAARGDIYRVLGKYEKAESDLQAAVSGLREVIGNHAAETLTAIDHLGMLCLDQGRLEAAEQYLQEAYSGRQDIFGKEHPDTLQSLNNLGSLSWQQGDIEKAAHYFSAALDGRASLLGEHHISTLESLNDVGVVLWKQGSIEQAEAKYRTALAGYRQLFGNEHPATQVTINNLAVLLKDAGRLDEAEAFYHETLDTLRRLHGDDHPETLRAMANLGLLLRAKGEYLAAEPYYQTALEGRRELLGMQHPSTISTIQNSGFLMINLGHYDQAEDYFREALEIKTQVYGEQHWNTYRSMNSLAFLLRITGKNDESETLQRQSLSGQLEQLGPSHPDTLRSMSNLAILLQQQGLFDEAEKLYRDSYTQQVDSLGADDFDTQYTAINFADLLSETGRHEEALRIAANAISACRQGYNQGGFHLGEFQTVYGQILTAAGQYDQARTVLHQAWDLLNEAGHYERHRMPKLINGLVTLYNRMDEKYPDQDFDEKAKYWQGISSNRQIANQ
ncbi:MAG: hypothetical protein Tsb002_00410 [Wenzhouxiangellaceae bacterium]